MTYQYFNVPVSPRRCCWEWSYCFAAGNAAPHGSHPWLKGVATDWETHWIFQVSKVRAFSPEKPTKRQKFYISGRSRHIYIYVYIYMSIQYTVIESLISIGDIRYRYHSAHLPTEQNWLSRNDSRMDVTPSPHPISSKGQAALAAADVPTTRIWLRLSGSGCPARVLHE